MIDLLIIILRLRCHRPGQPAHGPNYRLTKKVNGKTVSETFSSSAEQRKAQREVEAFHRFQQLGRELLAVNEKICQARPVEDTLTPQEKKRPRRSNTKEPPRRSTGYSRRKDPTAPGRRRR